MIHLSPGLPRQVVASLGMNHGQPLWEELRPLGSFVPAASHGEISNQFFDFALGGEAQLSP